MHKVSQGLIVLISLLFSACGKPPATRAEQKLEADFPEQMNAFRKARDAKTLDAQREKLVFGGTPSNPLVGSETGSPYIPSASGTAAPADKVGMVALDCSYSHTMLELRLPDSSNRFAIGAVSVNPERGSNLVPTATDEKGDCHFLLPSALLSSAEKLTLPLFVKDGSAYVAVTACTSNSKGHCKDESKNLSLDTARLFALLSGSPNADYVRVTYRSSKTMQTPGHINSSVIRGFHPGRSAVLQNLADTVLGLRDALGAKSMADLIQISGLGDCDMTALAIAQLTEDAGTTAFIAIGNKGMVPWVVDIATKNHAWNLYSSDSVNALVVRDDTYITDKAMEAFFTQKMAEAVLANGGRLGEGVNRSSRPSQSEIQKTPNERKLETEGLFREALQAIPESGFSSLEIDELLSGGLPQVSVTTRRGSDYYKNASSFDLGFDTGVFWGRSGDVFWAPEQPLSGHSVQWLKYEKKEGVVFPCGTYELKHPVTGKSLSSTAHVRVWPESALGLPSSGGYPVLFDYASRVTIDSTYNDAGDPFEWTAAEFITQCEKVKGIELKRRSFVFGEVIVD